MNAIRDAYSESMQDEFSLNNKVAFSSKTKWSGMNFKEKGSFVIGAPEFVLRNEFEKYAEFIKKNSENYRVLVVAHSQNNFNDNS